MRVTPTDSTSVAPRVADRERMRAGLLKPAATAGSSERAIHSRASDVGGSANARGGVLS
jgi:hypothetical protein